MAWKEMLFADGAGVRRSILSCVRVVFSLRVYIIDSQRFDLIHKRH